MSQFQIQSFARFFLALVVFGAVSFSVVSAADESQGAGADQIQPIEIQRALAEAGFYKGTVDGIVGSKTRAAIRAFQEKNGLVVDGVCGPRTWEKLKAYLEEAAEMDALQNPPTPSLDESMASEPVARPAQELESEKLKQKLVP